MRSHYCGVVDAGFIDQEVTLCGWVHRRRDHGGVIFIDLRDREGLIQVVIDPDTPDIFTICLLYTSPSPRDKRQYRMPSSA